MVYGVAHYTMFDKICGGMGGRESKQQKKATSIISHGQLSALCCGTEEKEEDLQRRYQSLKRLSASSIDLGYLGMKSFFSVPAHSEEKVH
jgi:hypothetical protein